MLAPYGSYSSYLGVECRSAAAAGQPSMHLVFDPDSPDNTDAELNRVCLHELGHALGLIHEHERPDRPLVWNQPAVLAYYRHLTDWSWADIKQQVIDPYEAPIIIETAFDPQSIMMYPFPAGLATYENGTPFVTGWNQTLSNRDKAIAGAMYPFPSVPTGAP